MKKEVRTMILNVILAALAGILAVVGIVSATTKS